MEVKINIENDDGCYSLCFQCPICGYACGIGGEREWSRKNMVRLIKRHMSFEHGLNPNEYDMKFGEWF